jgi:DNA-binding response OmpR family regulator
LQCNNKPQYRILIVDDERDITSVIKKGLQSNGFEVDAFTDPLLALKNFRAGVYDFLVLDVKMPKMNGFELYKQMKSVDDRVKICFLTAIEFYYEEFTRVFPTLNVGCFTRKPISVDELAKKIMEELESSSSSS